ncbi:protein-L-isoaspartate(D-aspartate) O-methyltransferase [Thermonema sp.]|uniref:protein-L-isoaspartate(D-aspartate) O-methyltransferase n=1 Tax=Thermonema sp. TaxID=2231181 RepID=UPI00258BBC90|nr:protein-L-isoaspartate(D-aspartate) O-methyltransferase [Thermonema sp.]
MYKDEYRHKGMRRQLVNKLRQKGIKDERVLQAIELIPRHWFLDSAFLEHAYQDKAFPIDEGQTISQPYTVAYQTELLQVTPGMRVLEIGTGSGYQACILAAMGAKVFTIEYHDKLFKKAKQMFTLMGLEKHIQAFCGDGSKGLPQCAPFDRILITAAAPGIPKELKNQLAIGGRLVAPVGDQRTQRMHCIVRKSEDTFEEIVGDFFKFVPLLGKYGWKK